MEQNESIFDNPDVVQMTEIGGQQDNDGSGNNKKPKKKKRIWLRVLVVILILLIAAGIAAGVAIHKAYKWVGEELDMLDHVKLPTKDLCIDPAVEKELKDYRNILIMGIDKREGEDIEKCRSDAMIVASINKKTGKFKMISVVRDSFLLLEENDQMVLDKLTHAHAYNGPVNTVRAINRNLDLNIKEFVRVDWKTVADTVDCLGGLELPITEDEISEMNKYIKDTNKNLHGSKKKIKKAGMQKLNGIQVVTYCRIRKNDGDEQRAERYRAAMAAALKKAKGMKFEEIDKAADTVLPQITTNIPSKEIIELAIDTLKKRKELDLEIDESVGWPYTWDGIQLNGVWYDVPITLCSNDIDLHKDIFDNKDYKPSKTVENINQLIIDETGFDENSPVQITNKKDKKKK